MSENSSYLCEKLVIQAIIPTHKTCCCMSPNRRKIILTDLQTHTSTAHNAITFHARGTTCNWYHLLLLVCLCVCACCQCAHWQEMELRVLIVPLDRDWVTWEEWWRLDFRGMGAVVMEPWGRLKDVFWHVALNSCNPAWSDRFTQPNTYCIFQFIITSINRARKEPF